jgi:hypothetical protein
LLHDTGAKFLTPATMIQLPTGFVADLTANANTQIANFSPLLLLIMGVLLSVLVIGALISFINRKQ